MDDHMITLYIRLYLGNIQMDEYNPRATVIESRTEDEEKIELLLNQLWRTDNLNASSIFTKWLEEPCLREEPTFIQNLFSNHLPIVREMFTWMLNPCSHTSPINQQTQNLPTHCKNFMKDNWCFYEQLYLAAINGSLPFVQVFSFLSEKEINPETVATALGYFEEVMLPFAKYQFSGSAQIMYALKKLHEDTEVKSIGIMGILPPDTIKTIISYSHYSSVYKFLHTAILISLSDPNDIEEGIETLASLFQYFKQPHTLPQTIQQVNAKYQQFLQNMADSFENLTNSFKEMLENIESDQLDAYLSVCVRSELMKYLAAIIVNSEYCRNGEHQKVSPYADHEEDIIEYMLTILMYTVQIYLKIPQSSLKQSLKEHIQYLVEELPPLSQLVLHSQNKSIPISSGQNIKPITFMKYAFFKLLHSCLKAYQIDQVEVNVSKIPVLQMVERYLIENRWNNIVHQTLEKICQIIISKNFKILNQNISEITDGFVGMLIQNFTNRNYIFLNTFNFTTQGNLHSLYVIAKAIAYEFSHSNQLVMILHESELWKKFLMNDLKKYEDKVYGPIIKPEEIEFRRSHGQFQSLQVDEFDSIKKLIDNISVKKKWPIRNSYLKKKNTLSAIFRKSGDVYTISSGEEINNYSSAKPSQKNLKALSSHLRQKTEEANLNTSKEELSFEIDELEMVMQEHAERQRPKLAKSDILKPSPDKSEQKEGKRDKEKEEEEKEEDKEQEKKIQENKGEEQAERIKLC